LLREDLDEPHMVMRIVSYEGRPFAYVQDYDVHVWPQPHFNHLPAGSRAIDAFIGEPSMISQGHGSVFLRLLAERLPPKVRRSLPSIPMWKTSGPVELTKRRVSAAKI